MNLIGHMIGCSSPLPYKDFDKQLLKSLQYMDCESKFKLQWKKMLWMVPLIEKSPIVGVEIEVENIRGVFPLPDFWTKEIDQSLRNHGVEFKSAPLKAGQLYQALVLLWVMFDQVNRDQKPSFSWRVSNHLHVNMNDLTEEQFQVFILLGILLEKLLFAMAADYRDQSVFCVPIRESTIIGVVKAYLGGSSPIPRLIQGWPKYTAIHLGRMAQNNELGPALGTAEFRHQSGTPKLEHLLIWITTIIKMYQYATKTSLKDLTQHILTLNSDSHYSMFMKEVLGVALMEKFQVANFSKIFSKQVSVCKRILLDSPEMKGASKSSLDMVVVKDIKKKKSNCKGKKSRKSN